ncbi:MAG: DUF58 domain-containing protein [Oscillospiraceae bacterium]|nr:DUF58 domain-containing protein [Oscillospiraceae bacterium]
MEFIALILIILLVIFVQNRIYAKYAFRNFRYTCSFSVSKATEGDEIEFTEELSNAKLLPLPWLKTELSTSKWLEFSGLSSTVTGNTRLVTSFFSVKSYCKIKRTWKIRCLRRGKFRIENISVIASDILANRKLSCFIDMDELNTEITVLPGINETDYNVLQNSMTSGDIFVSRQLISDPFFYNGIREYTQNDPYKAINWLASAKEGRLMVNKNDYTTDSSITVIMNIQSREADINQAIFEDYIECCIRTSAACVRASCEQHIPVRFMCSCCDEERRESMETEYVVDEYGFESILDTMASIEYYIYDSFDNYLSNLSGKLDNTQIVVVSSYISRKMNILAQEYPNITIITPSDIQKSINSTKEDSQ